MNRSDARNESRVRTRLHLRPLSRGKKGDKRGIRGGRVRMAIDVQSIATRGSLLQEQRGGEAVMR